MNQRKQETAKRQQERERLIEQLSQNIIESARPLIDPATNGEQLNEVRRSILERIQFESNVALSEVVTRFAKTRAEAEAPKAERTFLRFPLNFRLQHILMFTSVLTLIITGMPLKFPDWGISRFIIVDVFGGVQHSTLVHRIAAVGLITVGVWHLLYTFFSRIGRRDFLLMIPRPKDIVDFVHTILFYIGRRASGPKAGRFSFIEKFDYWAVYWGMVIMIGSGVILWFKVYFPKELFDIAREAHSDEGLLATLAIIVWHFYNVHLNPEVFPMSWVWWHGRLTESEMKHHHPLEYAEIVTAEHERLLSNEATGPTAEEDTTS